MNLPKAVQFEGYLEPINKALSDVTLSGLVAMRSLNTARVGLKHHGVLPAHASIEGYRADTTSFLETNTALVFDDTDFTELDMTQLVTFPKTKFMLGLSLEHEKQGEISDALGHVSLAFAYLLREFRERTGWAGFAGWTSISAPSVADDEVSGALGELASEVEGELARLEEAIDLVALGIDLRRWQRFVRLVPPVRASKEELGYIETGKTARLGLGPEEVDSCRTFVVDAALRLQTLPP